VILPASADLDRLYGKVETGDGLELAEGAQIAPTERPVEGIPIRHSIKVLPKKDGIFTVNAVVSADAAGQSWSQTFSIPVIVGAPLPEVPAKPPGSAATTKAGSVASRLRALRPRNREGLHGEVVSGARMILVGPGLLRYVKYPDPADALRFRGRHPGATTTLVRADPALAL